MDGLYLVSQGSGEAVKVGHTLIVSKTIQVADIYRTGLVTGSDRNKYRLGIDWDYKFTIPKQWPPVAGDVWEADGVRYAAIYRDSMIILEAMTRSGVLPVMPDRFQWFLDMHPILVFRG